MSLSYRRDDAATTPGIHPVDDIVVVEASDDVDDGVRLPDVAEELVAEAFALGGALHEARDVDEFDGRRHDVLRMDQVIELLEPTVGNGDDAGIRLFSGDTRVEGNNVTDNPIGIASAGFGALFIRNVAAGNATAFSFSGSDKYGPIIGLGSGDMSATAGSDHPWANFAY